MINKLRLWEKDGCNWEEALKIYADHVGEDFYLELATKDRTSFSEKPILKALYDIIDNHKDSVAAVELTKPPELPIVDKETWPAILKETYERKSELYRSAVQSRKVLKRNCNINFHGSRLTVSEALAIMGRKDRQGINIPFSIHFVKCDMKTKQAGEIVFYEKATLRTNSVYGSKTGKGRSNHQHWKNGTRNIIPIGTRTERKIHIWLILSLNGQEVILNEPG